MRTWIGFGLFFAVSHSVQAVSGLSTSPKGPVFHCFYVCPVATVLHNLMNRCILVGYLNDLTNAAPCYVRHIITYCSGPIVPL